MFLGIISSISVVLKKKNRKIDPLIANGSYILMCWYSAAVLPEVRTEGDPGQGRQLHRQKMSTQGNHPTLPTGFLRMSSG